MVTTIAILLWALMGAVLLLFLSPWNWPGWAGILIEKK